MPANVRISKDGRITIPKSLREQFGLYPNVEIEVIPTENRFLIRKKNMSEHPVDRVSGILDGADFDIDAYIEEIRGR